MSEKYLPKIYEELKAIRQLLEQSLKDDDDTTTTTTTGTYTFDDNTGTTWIPFSWTSTFDIDTTHMNTSEFNALDATIKEDFDVWAGKIKKASEDEVLKKNKKNYADFLDGKTDKLIQDGRCVAKRVNGKIKYISDYDQEDYK